MRGVVFNGNCSVDFVDVPDPTPGQGEVVLEIKASGMCGSDLHFYRAPRSTANPHIIAGHEPCGVVVAVGPNVMNPHAYIGSRVMVHHYHGCAGCAECRSGWPQMCLSAEPITVYGTDAHGGHAPYMKVAADTLVPLAPELSFKAGAAISCGTGTAWGGLERMGLKGTDTIAVFGQGPVGLSATILAKAQGARVIALDIDPSRLATAEAHCADFIVNPMATDAVDAIKGVTGGRGADMAMETAGASQAGQDAIASVRPWGTVCLVGIGATVNLSLAQLLRKQLTIVTSWTMSIWAQHECADFIIQRDINLDSLFTDSWRLDQADEAYRKFGMQSGGKGVFLF